ncbi:hypothetical protein N7528_008108 [Penicillium herquei]|nr:hypothetical protein N7528_008108 [Penicillium herquei]
MDDIGKLPLGNFAVMIGGMQVAKRLDFDDANVLNSCRSIWLLSNFIVFLMIWMIRSQIKKKKDEGSLSHMTNKAPTLTPDISIVKKTNKPPEGSDAKKKETEKKEDTAMTVHDYDLAELKKMVKNQFIDIGIMAVVHLYLGKTAPMIAQSIMPIKRVIQSNLAQIHLFGRLVIGDLERPFNSPPGILKAIGSRVVQLATGTH